MKTLDIYLFTGKQHIYRPLIAGILREIPADCETWRRMDTYDCIETAWRCIYVVENLRRTKGNFKRPIVNSFDPEQFKTSMIKLLDMWPEFKTLKLKNMGKNMDRFQIFDDLDFIGVTYEED